jgi:hypothetical protein
MAVPAEHKRARAGRFIYENPEKPLKDALIHAGYSPMTARKPKHAGLDAQRCLEAAERADLIPSAATLRDQARHVLKLKLGRLVEDRKQLDGARLSEIARALDVTERAYSGSTSPADDARGFVDRLEFIAAVQRELVKRSESRQVEMVESHELEAHPLENKGDSEPASDNM